MSSVVNLSGVAGLASDMVTQRLSNNVVPRRVAGLQSHEDLARKLQEEMEKNRKTECKIIVNEIVSLTASAYATAPGRYQIAVQNFKSVSSSAEFQSSKFESTVDKFNTVMDGELTVAVMGLVIIGHRWQQERRQGLNLKWSDQV
ncbi:RING/FYVE/PHD zinc finger superfamily protein [Perilla frutescens var. hirtella]|uniref:RING/FYVE/PHD zinc finger superfamily protein n=1 Tax=Perilla frutescens var. hirtella TaxID=608512 RepID=A0AAD4NXX9_PERFH|nr:RING/FYVE/PHD zinc finger superfamily protein [Perilla frutescens var. hirtella]